LPGEPAVIPPTAEMPPPPPATSINVEENEMMPNPSPPPELHGLVDRARADLARRLSIDVAAIDLLEVREVVWPDASLGCPQPGMAYIQVLQDGTLIRLAAEGAEYAYHSGGNQESFLCEQKLGFPKATVLGPDD
jgi:hypothetical protein